MLQGTSDAECSAFCRQVKGPGISIIVALLLVNVPVGRNRLARLTGYSEPSVQKGLQQLEMLGLAQRHGMSWALTVQCRQLVTPLDVPAISGSDEIVDGDVGEGGLIEWLCGLGVPVDKAQVSIQAALQEWDLDTIQAQCDEWRAYVESSKGSTIQHGGFFIAAKLRKREKAPIQDDLLSTEKYLGGRYGHLINH